MTKGGRGDERGREAFADQEKFLTIPVLFQNRLDPGESVLHCPRGKRRPGPRPSDPKKIPAKPTGDVRPAPAARAGAIRRANRAGANERARPPARNARKGGGLAAASIPLERRPDDCNRPPPRAEAMLAARLARGGRLAESHTRTNHETYAIRMQNMTFHDTSGGIPAARRVALVGTQPLNPVGGISSVRLAAIHRHGQSRRAGGGGRRQ